MVLLGLHDSVLETFSTEATRGTHFGGQSAAEYETFSFSVGYGTAQFVRLYFRFDPSNHFESSSTAATLCGRRGGVGQFSDETLISCDGELMFRAGIPWWMRLNGGVKSRVSLKPHEHLQGLGNKRSGTPQRERSVARWVK